MVIELKVSRGYDRVVGQLIGYVSWVIENLAEEGQSVRGFIIARNISDDLLLACKQLSDVELSENELSRVSLQEGPISLEEAEIGMGIGEMSDR